MVYRDEEDAVLNVCSAIVYRNLKLWKLSIILHLCNLCVLCKHTAGKESWDYIYRTKVCFRQRWFSFFVLLLHVYLFFIILCQNRHIPTVRFYVCIFVFTSWTATSVIALWVVTVIVFHALAARRSSHSVVGIVTVWATCVGGWRPGISCLISTNIMSDFYWYFIYKLRGKEKCFEIHGLLHLNYALLIFCISST